MVYWSLLHSKRSKDFKVIPHLLSRNFIFEHSHKPFHLFVLPWVVQRDVICSREKMLQKFSNSLAVKWDRYQILCFLVCHISQTVHVIKSCYWSFWIFALINFRPFSETLNYHKIMWPIHRTRKFYIQSSPRCVCLWLSFYVFER